MTFWFFLKPVIFLSFLVTKFCAFSFTPYVLVTLPLYLEWFLLEGEDFKQVHDAIFYNNVQANAVMYVGDRPYRIILCFLNSSKMWRLKSTRHEVPACKLNFLWICNWLNKKKKVLSYHFLLSFFLGTLLYTYDCEREIGSSGWVRVCICLLFLCIFMSLLFRVRVFESLFVHMRSSNVISDVSVKLLVALVSGLHRDFDKWFQSNALDSLEFRAINI